MRQTLHFAPEFLADFDGLRPAACKTCVATSEAFVGRRQFGGAGKPGAKTHQKWLTLEPSSLIKNHRRLDRGPFMQNVTFAFVLGLATAVATGAWAQPFRSPTALIEALYAPYLGDGDTSERDAFFSNDLTKLYETDAEKSQGEVGAIGFDPVINGQDWDIANLRIGKAEITGPSAVVTVRFENFSAPVTLRYSLMNEAGNWQVDDIESTEGDTRWTLSEIFANAQY
ncbi:hypothetical protein ASD02_07460 [Ensifer sp. Root1252]|nr:hypothetical protein ASD02_07460 [Ensifer sp. Root1252]KQW74503.1 hypothetical protein ASD03_08100 [Ensifer sp. Root127]KQY62089.1 hypothetical protein ASD52_15770 [Ensifer sp. Root142]KRC67634.1 hypothetical protein ASE32_10920 [Ensifer sp. Root231]